MIDRYIPLEEVESIFARARVVVTPYTAGYQSGIIHLAMTMGRAVVTADVGDLGAAVVDGETGLVVKPGDPGELADALEQVISDQGLAARLGAAGRGPGHGRLALGNASPKRWSRRSKAPVEPASGRRPEAALHADRDLHVHLLIDSLNWGGAESLLADFA